MGSDVDLGAVDTSDRIAEAALERFARHGYEGTSMRDIAADVEVTAAALYYHYRSKDEILEAVVEPLLCDLETLVAASGSTGEVSTAERWTRLDKIVEILLRHPDILAVLVSDVSVASHRELWRRVRKLTVRLTDLVLVDASDVGDRIRATAAIGALLRPVTALDRREIAANADLVVAAAGRALGLPERS